MTITNAYSRQPTKFDYASPTQFKFQLLKLPKVEYFCTAVNIPGVTLSNVDIATPLKSIPTPGTILDYGDLEMSFLVDENLENFDEDLSEIEQKIVKILDQKIRPAVARDGGDIKFKEFKDGVVKVQLQGS